MPVNNQLLTEFNDLQSAYKYCKQKIIELKGSKFFYIGGSHDPEKRCADHKIEKGMETMYLLCKTQTKHDAKMLEKKLVKRFKDNIHIVNTIKYDNEGKPILNGGFGLIEGINYIYVLFK
ncbi:MAG: hypothetical protein Terrestrivirus8_17 [Terrestrivirus sp.]|uniref:GIY-YIG domain-containing protein n=1 Tax=Terrestrivirus sp. TaxID=2487775 RepID=A0A3G4ZQC3_9VIRU|nr:MAG: hypothetical protein Terrestrivirus8_17 [Terrestrivirus sp.]